MDFERQRVSSATTSSKIHGLSVSVFSSKKYINPYSQTGPWAELKHLTGNGSPALRQIMPGPGTIIVICELTRYKGWIKHEPRQESGGLNTKYQVRKRGIFGWNWDGNRIEH